MPLTPYRASPTQQFAAQTSMDPSQSPVGKLRGNLSELYRRGIDPMQVEQQYQAGAQQQKAIAEDSGEVWNPLKQGTLGASYSSAIPSMRNNLMKLSQPKLQQPRFALPNTRAQY